MSKLIKEHIDALKRKADEVILSEEEEAKKKIKGDEGKDEEAPAEKPAKEKDVKAKDGEEEEDESVKESAFDFEAIAEEIQESVLGELTEASKITVDDTMFRSICESQEFEADFTDQISTAFTVAVKEAVHNKVAELSEKASEVSAIIMAKNFQTISEKADGYLDYVNEYLEVTVNEWIEENKPQLVESLRMEKATAFMEEMADLLGKYQMEVPGDKVDLYTESVAQNSELIERMAKLEEANTALAKELIMSVYTKDLSAIATERMVKLAESIEYAGDTRKFIETLDLLSEGVKPKRPVVESQLDEDFTEPLVEADAESPADTMSPEVRAAAAAISRLR